MRTVVPSLVLLLAIPSGIGLTPADVMAQDAVIEDARLALGSYEVAEGGRTLRALADLGPMAESGDPEASYMRAVAGAELYAASVVLDDGELRARLAAALGVSEPVLREHIDAALAACRTGPFAAGASGARLLLATTDAFVRDPAAMTAMRGPHRDALVGIAIAEHPDVARRFAGDPCSGSTSGSDRTVCDWDEPSRRALAAMREALAALGRADRARRDGDPLLSLLADRMAGALTTLRSARLRPWVPGMAPAEPTVVGHGGELAALDAVVVVTEAEVQIHVMPVVRLDASGALVWTRGGGAPTVVPFPATLPPVPQAIDELSAAVAHLGLPEGASVGLFPSATLSAHLLVRADLSLARGQARPTHLVAVREDGAPTSVAFRSERENDVGTVDARVRIRMGGYGLGRGSHGRESSIPRVHAASGLSFDVATLHERLSAGRFAQTVAVDAMGTVPAAEVVRVAFAAEAPSRAVILLLP